MIFRVKLKKEYLLIYGIWTVMLLNFFNFPVLLSIDRSTAAAKPTAEMFKYGLKYELKQGKGCFYSLKVCNLNAQ